MKTYLLAICIFLPLYSFAQGPSKDEKELEKALTQNVAGQRDISAFEKELEDLRKKYQLNEARLFNLEKINYDRNRNNLIYSLSVLDQALKLQDAIELDKQQQKASALVARLNSPVSDELGFKFTDVVFNLVEKRINESVSVEADKTRVKGTFINLIDGLKESFPPLSIISSVISVFSNVIKPKIDTVSVQVGRRVPPRLINSYNSTNVVFNQEQMRKFLADIKPYTEFYTSLNKINISYDSELDSHTIKYRDFISDMNGLKQLVKETYGKDLNQLDANECNTMFKYGTLSSLQDYQSINESSNMKASPKIVISVTDILVDFYKYYSDYSLIVDKNIENTVATLESAKALPSANGTKIQQAINSLKAYWGGGVTPGFRNKFGNYMSSIKTAYKKVERY